MPTPALGLLFPHLPVPRATAEPELNLTGPFGEIIANDIVPSRSQS